MNRAFTLGEILVVIAIMLVIGGISSIGFYHARNTSRLNTASDRLVATIERAKADAISGKDGDPAGVRFSTSSYAYFAGTSYNAADSRTVITSLQGFRLSGNLASSTTSVLFSRIYGTPSATGTAILIDTSSGLSKTITITDLGAITSS